MIQSPFFIPDRLNHSRSPENVTGKKEIEKIILCDVQKEIQIRIEKAFTDLINNSGFKQVEVKNIDFDKLYNSKFV